MPKYTITFSKEHLIWLYDNNVAKGELLEYIEDNMDVLKKR